MNTRTIFRHGGKVDLWANILLIIGLLGMALEYDQWGSVIVGLGLFGPYLLRELGFLPWCDEFQREIFMRSGMHALLGVGILVTAIMAIEGVGGRTDLEGNWLMKDSMTASTVLLVLAVIWILSRLLQYWGTLIGSRRFLIGYFSISFVGISIVFVSVLGHGIGFSFSKWFLAFAQIGWIGILALGVYRWPRIVGFLLLGTLATTAPHIIAIAGQNMGEPAWVGVIVETCVLILPLLIPGFALVLYKKK